MRQWIVRSLLSAALAVPFFWSLGAEEFHGDESHWLSAGQQAFYLLRAGRLGDAQWRDEFYFYSQPQLGKLAIGAALAAAGVQGQTRVYDYDWQKTPPENRALGRVPAGRAVAPGRVPGALAGWLTCLTLWLLASRLGQADAGRLGAVLLASHPLWLANSRRAGLDTTALFLGLCAAATGIEALRQASDGRRAWRASWWLGSGALLGLALGTKYVGALTALLGGAAALWEVRWRRDAGRVVSGGAVALVVAAVVFVGANPALYHDPIRQLRVSLDFLAWQADGMRQVAPGFRSPLWVAVEIVDRAFWPLGVPRVVDQTLPEPLVPGSYGTPIVALGASAAAVLAWRLRCPAGAWRLLRAGATWAALVFVALALSLPTWWERWHLPLVPPLAMVAGVGLGRMQRYLLHLGRGAAAAPHRRTWDWLPGSVVWSLAAAQYLAAVAMLPSFLGKGFGALVTTPPGAAAHLGALALTLSALVLLHARRRRHHGHPLPLRAPAAASPAAARPR